MISLNGAMQNGFTVFPSPREGPCGSGKFNANHVRQRKVSLWPLSAAKRRGTNCYCYGDRSMTERHVACVHISLYGPTPLHCAKGYYLAHS